MTERELLELLVEKISGIENKLSQIVHDITMIKSQQSFNYDMYKLSKEYNEFKTDHSISELFKKVEENSIDIRLKPSDRRELRSRPLAHSLTIP